MTQQEPNQQQYPQNYPPYEDEINLIDYLRVLWKWKWLIIAGTLICAVAAAVISSQMPKIYRKENISNIKVLQNPEVSSAPIKSKKKQIVLLATVVTLFMSVFLAFFIEYIKNATRSTK